jgi:hypothetical protein
MNVGANRQLAAELGARYIDNTYGKIFGDFCFITAVSAATLTVSGGNITDATSVTLAQGQTIRGRYTELTVSSGAVICYNSKYPVNGGIYTASNFPYDDFFVHSQWGAVGTIIASGTSATSSLGKTISVTAGSSVYSMIQGVNWLGDFPPGEYLVYSWGNTLVNFNFASPVRGVGLQIQSGTLGPYAANYTFKDSSNNPIATAFGFGLSTTKQDNTALFLGYESSVQNISKVSIELTGTAKLGKFSVGKLYIKS